MENQIMFNKSLSQQPSDLNISWLGHIIDTIRPTLPIQNPMPFFVHNNPIQNWEKYPFQEGICDAVLTFENTGELKSRVLWRELEDFVLPIVISYFDQSLHRWSLDSYKTSLWDWFCHTVKISHTVKAPCLKVLKENLSVITKGELPVTLNKILEKRCPNKDLWYSHIRTLVLHFKGWSGMIQVLEKDDSLFPIIKRNSSLFEWIAILVFTEQAINSQKDRPWWGVPLWNSDAVNQRKELIHKQLAETKERELHYYQSFLDQFQTNLISHLQKKFHSSSKTFSESTPKAQILLCLDDREESLRRALEATNPQYTTIGTLGFFGIDFSLKRPGHLIFQPHCPPVIRARKKAKEINLNHRSLSANIIRKLLSTISESRFTYLEPLLAITLWPVYAILLILRSLAPQIYAQMRVNFQTDVYLNEESDIEFVEDYALSDKVDILASLLKGAGLENFQSPLVVILGHASTTTNNPFQKSYGCGACSGQSGFSNAKVFAEFANDPEIREALKHKGVTIPDPVRFVAACHDTSRDVVVYAHKNESYLSSYPEANNIYLQFKEDMIVALEMNKQERWQQFQLSPFQSAHSRSADWSQPRPEFGHTGVSLAVFGPRWLTSNLHLERKAFLMSYDPELDPTGENLSYVILNALPVCANINLDYYTSAAFPDAFGAGSKLPLNIASGIGVMTGSKGDLRVGLATQMVDRHNPMRLLAIVYCDKAKLGKAISQSPRLKNIIDNNWIHLVRIDPQTYQSDIITEELKRELSHVTTFTV